MFFMTLRKGGLKKVGVFCACSLLLATAAIGASTLRFGGNTEALSTQASAKLTQQLGSAEDLVTFLQGYGVESDVTTATVSTVTVPSKWDDSFKAFHEVIEQSGLSLSKSKGDQVDKWALLIPSKSTEENKTYAIVLVQENKPVGAYLLEKPSGEVSPLTQAAQTSAPLTSDEISANADFGDSAEVVVVTDGTQDVAAIIDDEDAVLGDATETGAQTDITWTEEDMPTD